eukprot:RCo004393
MAGMDLGLSSEGASSPPSECQGLLGEFFRQRRAGRERVGTSPEPVGKPRPTQEPSTSRPLRFRLRRKSVASVSSSSSPSSSGTLPPASSSARSSYDSSSSSSSTLEALPPLWSPGAAPAFGEETNEQLRVPPHQSWPPDSCHTPLSPPRRLPPVRTLWASGESPRSLAASGYLDSFGCEGEEDGEGGPDSGLVLFTLTRPTPRDPVSPCSLQRHGRLRSAQPMLLEPCTLPPRPLPLVLRFRRTPRRTRTTVFSSS